MSIQTILNSLAACLCAQIEADGSPKTCFCGVIPGATAVQEYGTDCDNLDGMAWVRLALTYPSSAVGVQSQQVGNCSVGIGVDIEVGIMRTIPMDALPDEAELLAANQQQVKDVLTIRKAIACCPDLHSKDFILGSYTPSGPLGGLVGGAWTVHVGIV